MTTPSGYESYLVSKKGFMSFLEAQKEQRYLDKKEWTGESINWKWVNKSGERVDFSY